MRILINSCLCERVRFGCLALICGCGNCLPAPLLHEQLLESLGCLNAVPSVKAGPYDRGWGFSASLLSIEASSFPAYSQILPMGQCLQGLHQLCVDFTACYVSDPLALPSSKGTLLPRDRLLL